MRIAVVLALALAACRQPAAPSGDLPSAAAPAAASPPPAATAPAAQAPATGGAYRYRSSTLRSPFEPGHPGTVLATDGAQPDPHRPRAPLERFRLEELRLVGGIAAGGARYALVADPGGTIRRVAVGDYLGPNHGRVTGLARHELTLREIVRNDAGDWVWRPRSLVARASRPGAEPNRPQGQGVEPPEPAPGAPSPIAGGERT